MQHKLQHMNATGQDYVVQLGGRVFVNVCDSVYLFQMRKIASFLACILQLGSKNVSLLTQ